MKRYRLTTPIMNIIWPDQVKSDQYIQNLMHLCNARIDINLSSVQYSKLKLGKQDYCWTNLIRCWSWQGSTWVAHVSKKGLSFEVFDYLTVDQAWNAWQEYFNKVK